MGGILYFHNGNDYSGSTRVLADVIREREGSRSVTVVAWDISGGGFLSDMPGVRVINSHIRPGICGHRILLLSELIYRVCSFLIAVWYGRKYDIFYINTIMPSYAALAGRLMGKRIIWHVHESFVVHTPSTRRAEKIFLRTPAERIFVSEYLRGKYPDNGCPSVVRHNTLSPEFSSKVNVRPLQDRPLNTVLMIAAPTRAKGADKFVALAAMLPQFRFVLVAGDTAEKVSVFFKDTVPGGRELPSNLEIHPKQSSVHPFLEDADLLVSLSDPALWIETFGMTLLEAMAYGLPVIAPSVGGPVEVVGDGGICMDVTDLQAVASEINGLLGDRSSYAALADKALVQAGKFISTR